MEKVYDRNMVEIYKVSENVYYRKGDLPTRKQCCGAYFVTKTGVAAVDLPPEAAEMWEEAETLFHQPIKTVFLTHGMYGHEDHTGGLQDCLDKDVTVYCSRRMYDALVPSLPATKASFVGVDGVLQLRLFGELDIELQTFADTSHSKWDLFVRLKNEGALCTGDAVVEYATAFYHGADIDTWISVLQKLRAAGGEYLLPGHGQEPFRYDYISDFAEHLSDVRAAADRCFRFFGSPEGKLTASVYDKLRFTDVTAEEVRRTVAAYFAEGGELPGKLAGRAGAESAERQVRMVLWMRIRAMMR